MAFWTTCCLQTSVWMRVYSLKLLLAVSCRIAMLYLSTTGKWVQIVRKSKIAYTFDTWKSNNGKLRAYAQHYARVYWANEEAAQLQTVIIKLACDSDLNVFQCRYNARLNFVVPARRMLIAGAHKFRIPFGNRKRTCGVNHMLPYWETLCSRIANSQLYLNINSQAYALELYFPIFSLLL